MYDSYEMSPAAARVSPPARAVGSNDADRGPVVCGVQYWPFGEATGTTLDPDGGHLSLAGAINAGFARAIRVVAEDPGFGGEIEVAGAWSAEQAFMYLEGMKYNAWLRSQRSANLFAPVEGGIMTRLAEQPRVHTGADVLQTMASYECHATWEDVWKNMAVTNSFGLKGPGGYAFRFKKRGRFDRWHGGWLKRPVGARSSYGEGVPPGRWIPRNDIAGRQLHWG